MRLLVISERYPPHITGGYEIACASIAEGLRRRGHEVRVLTSDYGLNRPGVDDQGVHRLLHYKQRATGLWQLGRWELSDNRVLRKAISEWKPDVVSAWSMLHLFPSLHHVLREAGVPIVYNIHDAWLPRHVAEAAELESMWRRPSRGTVRDLAKRFARIWFRGECTAGRRALSAADLPLDHVVFCSRFRMTEHEGLGLRCGRGRVIYNGIDGSVFHGSAEYRPGQGPLKALFVGRFVPDKGVHTAVDAIRSLSRRGIHDVTLDVAGAAFYPVEYAANLCRAVEDEGLADRVRFRGMVPYSSLPDLYREHHVVVFPSVVNEGLPLSLLEAMACGLPVVGTTTGGSAEIIEDGVTGLAFPPGDPEALADRLSRLRTDEALFRSLVIAGHELVRDRFTLEGTITQTECFLREVCGDWPATTVGQGPGLGASRALNSSSI